MPVALRLALGVMLLLGLGFVAFTVGGFSLSDLGAWRWALLPLALLCLVLGRGAWYAPRGGRRRW